jgi:hypothetical protein
MSETVKTACCDEPQTTCFAAERREFRSRFGAGRRETPVARQLSSARYFFFQLVCGADYRAELESAIPGAPEAAAAHASTFLDIGDARDSIGDLPRFGHRTQMFCGG